MNTPNWMLDAPALARRRAKSERHNRRSTDRRGPSLNVVLAFGAMVLSTWGIYEVTSLLLH